MLLKTFHQTLKKHISCSYTRIASYTSFSDTCNISVHGNLNPNFNLKLKAQGIKFNRTCRCRFISNSLSKVTTPIVYGNTIKDSYPTRPYCTQSSNNPPESDDLSTLLGQLSSTKKASGHTFDYDVKLEPVFNEEPQQSLPGHRIRGILVPTAETHGSVINGQKYSDLPVANVKASYNNTIITISKASGAVICTSSGGIVGFRNAKKKTTIAAQTAGLDASKKAVQKGLTHIRVAIRGVGKGRLAACKGLEEGGLTVVSITDVTHIDFGSQTPRKKRRL